MNKEVLANTELPRSSHRALSIQLSEHRAILLTVDGIVVLLSLLIGLWFGAQRSDWEFNVNLIMSYVPWFIGVLALYFVLATANDAYLPKITADSTATFVALAKTVVQIFVFYLLIYALLPPNSLPRHFVGIFTAVSPFLLLAWRRLYGQVFVSAFQRRAIVVGAGWGGQAIAKTFADFAPAHFEIVGFVDDDPTKQQQIIQGKPVLGPTAKLVDTALASQATDVVMAITHHVPGEILARLIQCYDRGIRVVTMSEIYEYLTNRVPVEHIGDNWYVALPLDSSGQKLAYRLLKRLLDIGLALAGLVIFGLLLLPLAVAIKLDSPGPVFYRQKRVGSGGKIFQVIKLRSMITDAEQESGAAWASAYDRRITRAGRILRRSRLDELPQLLNVLRGEMSLIGPRPERPEFIEMLEQEIPFYRMRLAVKPGLTGWAQVNHDYGRTIEDALEKLRYDLYYIKRQSLHLDLLIMLKTINVILLLRGT